MNKRILRKFGFKNDQQGIMNRYIRESAGWEKHIKNTKEFILQSAEKKNKSTCFIIGSGWLLDVPIYELSKLFDKVTLVDIIHPSQIIHKVKRFKNVETIELDITGYIEPVFYFMQKANKSNLGLCQIKTVYSDFWFNELKDADFIVSVNIMNQLDILICDYILKFDIYSEHEINEFRKNIQQNHLNLLPKGKSCLITDYEELNIGDNNKIIKRKPLIYLDLSQGINSKKWQWNFDMNQSYNKNFNTVFEVIGMEM